MPLRIGQQVYVGWAPKCYMRNGDGHICRIAVIDGGPWEPGEKLQRYRTWHVDSGAIVAEPLLFPFDEPSSGEQTTQRKEITA